MLYGFYLFVMVLEGSYYVFKGIGCFFCVYILGSELVVFLYFVICLLLVF